MVNFEGTKKSKISSRLVYQCQMLLKITWFTIKHRSNKDPKKLQWYVLMTRNGRQHKTFMVAMLKNCNGVGRQWKSGSQLQSLQWRGPQRRPVTLQWRGPSDVQWPTGRSAGREAPIRFSLSVRRRGRYCTVLYFNYISTIFQYWIPKQTCF